MKNQVLDLSLLGDRLQLVRKSRKLTQEEMSKELKVGFTSYKAYEKGTSKLPLNALEILASKFDVSLDFLVLGKTADRNKTMQEISENTLSGAKIEKGFLIITTKVPLFEYVV